MLGTDDENENAKSAKDEDKDEKKKEGNKGSDTAKVIYDTNMLKTENSENESSKLEKDEDKRNDNKGSDIVKEIVKAEHISSLNIKDNDMIETEKVTLMQNPHALHFWPILFITGRAAYFKGND